MDSCNGIGLKLLMRLVRSCLIRSFERSGLSRIQLEPSELNCLAMVILAPMSRVIRHCATKQVSFTQKTKYNTQYTSSSAHALSLSRVIQQGTTVTEKMAWTSKRRCRWMPGLDGFNWERSVEKSEQLTGAVFSILIPFIELNVRANVDSLPFKNLHASTESHFS